MGSNQAGRTQASRLAKSVSASQASLPLQFASPSHGAVQPVRSQAQVTDEQLLSDSGSHRGNKARSAKAKAPSKGAVRESSERARARQKAKGARLLATRAKARKGRNPARLVLRTYQKDGVKFLLARRGAILGDAMGTGKSAQLICAMRLLCKDLDRWKVLIITTKNTLLSMYSEVATWWPSALQHTNIYSGKDRGLWSGDDKQLVIANYGVEQELMYELGWVVAVVDESHKAKNHKSLRHRTLKKIGRRSERMWLATGTPVRNHPVDIVAQAMLARAASSYWDTVERWFATCDTDFGQEIGGVRNPEAFKRWCSTFMLRRSKKQALPDLPDKTRSKLHVELTDWQQEFYDSLLSEMAAIVNTSEGEQLLLAPTQLSVITRLRQLMVSPRLLGFDKPGAAEKAVTEWSKNLREDKTKGVIFTPFRKAIPYLKQATKFPEDKIAVFTGGMTLDKMADQTELFKSSECRTAICTIQVAEGFSLTEASEGLFVGCDWSLAANEQAEDRLHRMGQTSSVRIQYITHMGTIEDDLLALLETKASYQAVVKEILSCLN